MRTFIVCVNSRPGSLKPSCAQRGSEALAVWLEQQIAQRQLDASVERSVCLGFCQIGPNIRPLGEAFVHEASIDKLMPLLEDTPQACGDGCSQGDAERWAE